MALGNINQIDSLEIDGITFAWDSIGKLDATHFVVAYLEDDGNNTIIKTYSVDGSYDNITEIDSVTLSNYYGGQCSLVVIDSTHFMLAVSGASYYGYIKTFSVDSGADNITEIDSLQHDATGAVRHSSLVMIDSTYYALAYWGGSGDDGIIKTFSIDGSYDNITQIDSYIHSNAAIGTQSWNRLLKIDSTHLILACADTGYSGHLKTFSIDANADNITPIDDLQHDSYYASGGFVMIDSTHFMLAYYGGSPDDGRIKTFSIDGSYDNIAEIDEVVFATTGIYDSLVHIGGSNYLLAFADNSFSNGILQVFTIDGSYEITETTNLLTHETSNSKYNSLIQLGLSYYALAYAGASEDGFIKTFRLDFQETINSNSQILKETQKTLNSDAYIKVEDNKGSFEVVRDPSFENNTNWDYNDGASRSSAQAHTGTWSALLANSDEEISQNWSAFGYGFQLDEITFWAYGSTFLIWEIQLSQSPFQEGSAIQINSPGTWTKYTITNPSASKLAYGFALRNFTGGTVYIDDVSGITGTIPCWSRILKSYSDDLDSDAVIDVPFYIKTLSSNAGVLKISSEELNSDANIFKQYSETLNSDAQILFPYFGSLSSDAEIYLTQYQNALDSDNYVKKTYVAGVATTEMNSANMTYSSSYSNKAGVNISVDKNCECIEIIKHPNCTATNAGIYIGSSTIVAQGTFVGDVCTLTGCNLVTGQDYRVYAWASGSYTVRWQENTWTGEDTGIVSWSGYSWWNTSPAGGDCINIKGLTLKAVEFTSNTHIQKTHTETLNSDSYIMKVNQETLNSYAHIQKIIQKPLTSDTNIFKQYLEPLAANTYILKTYHGADLKFNDTFPGTAINTDYWTEHAGTGSISVSGGRLHLTNDGTQITLDNFDTVATWVGTPIESGNFIVRCNHDAPPVADNNLANIVVALSSNPSHRHINFGAFTVGGVQYTIVQAMLPPYTAATTIGGVVDLYAYYQIRRVGTNIYCEASNDGIAWTKIAVTDEATLGWSIDMGGLLCAHFDDTGSSDYTWDVNDFWLYSEHFTSDAWISKEAPQTLNSDYYILKETEAVEIYRKDELIDYWKFNDNLDNQIGSRSWSAVGPGGSYVAGKFEQAWYNNGDSYLSMGGSNYPTTCTFVVWFNKQDTGNIATMGKFPGQFWVYGYASNLTIERYKNSSRDTVVDAVGCSAGDWHQLIYAVSPTSLQIWLDGTNLFSESGAATYNQGGFPTQWGIWYTGPVDVSITTDEMRVYDFAFVQADADAVWNGGRGDANLGIISNAYIFETYQQTINSNAFIEKEISGGLYSDTYVKQTYIAKSIVKESNIAHWWKWNTPPITNPPSQPDYGYNPITLTPYLANNTKIKEGGIEGNYWEIQETTGPANQRGAYRWVEGAISPPYSISIWMKSRTGQDWDNVEHGRIYGYDGAIQIREYTSGDRFRFTFQTSEGDKTFYTPLLELGDNQWHNIVLAVGDNGIDIHTYFDGDSMGSAVSPGGTLNAGTPGYTNYIGRTSLYAHGEIEVGFDDFRIYDTKLTEQDAQDITNLGIDGVRSDAYIFKAYVDAIASDSYIKYIQTETIDSTAYIKGGEELGLTSNSYIKKIVPQTINSDMQIVKCWRKLLSSDAFIVLSTIQNTLTSNAEISLADFGGLMEDGWNEIIEEPEYAKILVYRRFDFDEDNMTGDLDTDSYVDYQIYGDVQPMEIYDVEVKTNRLQVGDAEIFIPARVNMDITGNAVKPDFRPQLNDLIAWKGIWYRIDEIKFERIGTAEIYADCLAKRTKNVNPDFKWNIHYDTYQRTGRLGKGWA